MLDRLGSAETGLTAAAAAERLGRIGPNAIVSHRARLGPVLWHQLKSPLLGLLAIAAIASYFVGERSDAVIIGVILALSVGMGFVNEYRAEKAAEALHSQIRHRAVVLRDGQPASVDVTELVPGDVVELSLGDIMPGRHAAAGERRAGMRRVDPHRRVDARREGARCRSRRARRWAT